MNNRMKAKCYLCGSSDYSFRPGKVRDSVKLKVLECSHCGLVYLSDFTHINNSFYLNSGMHTFENRMPTVKKWLTETQGDDERRFSLYKTIFRNKALLDFGCGAGGFLLKARNICNKAYGIEPEIRLQEYFRERKLVVYPDLKCLKIDLGESTKFDVVTLFHVLEHMPDPRDILKEVGKIIFNDGRIIIEVPHANDALLSLYQNNAFSHFTYWSCHLFLFTEATLRDLAEQSGLKVNYIKQVQRYPLSNHLYWLAKGKPGGHEKWGFLDSDELRAAYQKKLAYIGCCDTLIASFQKRG
jgi:2-polyprenyl-3-methyl-5-hydroxy-6-metoxy-1,4-benzoquinol methylase